MKIKFKKRVKVNLGGIFNLKTKNIPQVEKKEETTKQDSTTVTTTISKNKDKGITIVLVSHNMDDVAAHADRVLIMEDGTLKMDGTTREIFARKNDLTTMGLGIPQTVEFYLELRKMQIQESIDSNRQTLQNENAIPLTIEELAECITGGSK